jgi:hypothetical protein
MHKSLIHKHEHICYSKNVHPFSFHALKRESGVSRSSRMIQISP